jgi:glycerol-3-phosphate dehydrogenase
VGLPAAAVAFCIRHEWTRTLADVVERRLMLVFDPRLSTRALHDIACVCVAAGILDPQAAAAAVDDYRDRLRRRFGRVLEEEAP